MNFRLDCIEKFAVYAELDGSAFGDSGEEPGVFELGDVVGEGGLGDSHLIENDTAGDALRAGVCSDAAQNLEPIGLGEGAHRLCKLLVGQVHKAILRSVGTEVLCGD